jgi:DNA-binding NtrC family response regulator
MSLYFGTNIDVHLFISILASRITARAWAAKASFNSIGPMSPDNLLTDIHMPQMSGLELIKKAKETDLNFEAILLSGYNEFNYAQEGIKLGAFDEIDIISIHFLGRLLCQLFLRN